MPELPDVEVFKQYLDATSLHKRVDHARVRDDEVLDGLSPQKLSSALVNHRLEETRRHGKHLGARADGAGWLLLHFGMTGSLRSSNDGAEEPEHTALLIEFEGGSRLAYTCQRKFGRVRWADDFDEFIESEGLGPDALDLSADEFRDLLDERRGSIKSLLMNQHAIAGIGNVYADESLFQSGIRPSRKTGSLSRKEADRLRRTLRRVCERAIDRRAQPGRFPRTWLLPHRNDGEDCPRCSGSIRKSTVGGRATYWCRECQQ